MSVKPGANLCGSGGDYHDSVDDDPACAFFRPGPLFYF